MLDDLLYSEDDFCLKFNWRLKFFLILLNRLQVSFRFFFHKRIEISMLIIFVEWLPVLNLYSLSYEWIPFHLSRTSAMRVRHYNNQMKPNGKKTWAIMKS